MDEDTKDRGKRKQWVVEELDPKGL